MEEKHGQHMCNCQHRYQVGACYLPTATQLFKAVLLAAEFPQAHALAQDKIIQSNLLPRISLPAAAQ